MEWDAMAVVGRIARPHGIRGQVIVNVETDFPADRFAVGAELFVNRSGRVETLTATTVRFQQGRPVIGFAGVGDMNAALELAGAELRVPIERLATLPDGTFYRHQLIGCSVETAEGVAVGVVSDVEGSMTGSRLVLNTPAGEVLVPLVAEICPLVDPGAKRIVIAPPDGLLDVNAVRRGPDGTPVAGASTRKRKPDDTQ
jgi:16S rRNA processing protein RimM